MNFYRRRPLALIITICVLASAAVYFLPGYLKIAFIALCAALAPVIVWILKGRGVNSVCNLSATAFVLVTAALMMAMTLTSFAYYDVYAQKYEQLQGGRVRATVLSVESRTAYDAAYSVRIDSLDGERVNAKGLVGTSGASTLNVGDVFEAKVTFCYLEDFYSYREASRTELLADGYVFAGNIGSGVAALGTSDSLLVWLARLRESFSAGFSLYLDSDSALLADALFLGKRADLGRIERDFSYIGVVHLLALSGLHLSVIGGGVERLFRRLGVGARTRYILTSALIIFYVALTGFHSSALRAAIMLMLTYTAAFFDAESDRITSLFAAVGIIVLADPTAIFDISLQLSFTATLGLLLVSEPSGYLARVLASAGKMHPIRRALIKALGQIVSSLGAIMFILPLQWLYFGEVSLTAVTATLIMTPICEALLILMPPLLICSLVEWHFACGVIGGFVRVLSGVCFDVARALFEHSRVVSLEYPFALPIMLLCAAAIVYMIVRNFPSWLYALIPFAVASALFLGCVGIYDALCFDKVSIDMVNYGANDMITLISNRTAAIIDVGDGSAQTVHPTLKVLKERYITEVETLVLTDVDRRHTTSIRKLMNYRRVKTLFIPSPVDEYEMYLAADIAELAGEYGCKTVFYDNSQVNSLTHGDVTVSIFERTLLRRSTSPLTAIRFSYAGVDAAYVGASVWESEAAWEFVNGAKYMLFGANGPSIKTSPPDTVKASTEVVYTSSGERVETLLEWLDGFSGSIIVKESLSAVIKP